jgi:hypothetical protein
LLEHRDAVKSEAIDGMAALATAAFRPAAALAWNGAVLAAFKEIFWKAKAQA